MLVYKKFCYGNMFSNTYLVWDENSREALIADCGNTAEPILNYVKENGLSVRFIILTHAHYDHALYVDEYRAAFADAEILIGEGDAPLLSDIEGNVSYLFGDSRAFKSADKTLRDGDTVSLGDEVLEVISTPGHTPGCICLYSRIQKFMITGDTLFAGGGIGRTDFKFGDFDILRVSLRRILSMDGEITILPGHGGASKIGYEQRALLY